MKKTFIVACVTLLFLSGCGKKDTTVTKLEAIKSKGEIVLVTSPDYAPYEFIDATKTGQDQYVGADIELAKFIANEIGVDLVIKAMSFGDIASAVSLGKFDMGIAGFTFNEERAEQVDFSNTYDTTESTCQGFLVTKEKEATLNTIDDLKTAKVAVQNGSLPQTYVETELPEATMQLVNTLDDAVLQLNVGKVDAIAASCASGEGFTLNNKNLVVSKVKFATIDDNGTKVILEKGKEDLMDEVNKAIAKAVELDLYKQWLADATSIAEQLGAID